MDRLNLRQLSWRQQGQQIIAPLNLAIRPGEFVAVVGPSGCGKSSLLRLIAGLEEPSGGEIWIDGVLCNAIRPAQRGVGMVFQSYALYPHMTVQQNLQFGLKMTGKARSTIEAQLRYVCRILQLDDYLQRKPAQLSGGQCQRVAIGRALMRQPRIMLFDEPLSNLDANLRQQLKLELAKLHQQLADTVLYVTHDQAEAMTLADRILVLRHGQVEQFATPRELYQYPKNAFVAGFIGAPAMNFMTVECQRIAAQTLEIKFDDYVMQLDIRAEVTVATTVTIGIRPEHWQVMLPTDTALPVGVSATLIQQEYLGASTLLHLSCVGQRLCALSPAVAALAHDAVLKLCVLPEHVYVFDENGDTCSLAHFRNEHSEEAEQTMAAEVGDTPVALNLEAALCAG